MAVKYICRHCKTTMGEIEAEEISEARLGFHFLTPEERKDIITYNPDGAVTVHLSCDYCREALEAHPELNLVNSPLQ
mgnify:CR=1 FL=1